MIRRMALAGIIACAALVYAPPVAAACTLSREDFVAMTNEILEAMEGDERFQGISANGRPRVQLAPANTDGVRSALISIDDVHNAVRNTVIEAGLMRLFVGGLQTPTDFTLQAIVTDNERREVTLALALASHAGAEVGRWNVVRSARCQ